MVFQVFHVRPNMNKYFCPVCGENTAVYVYRGIRHESNRKQIRWTEEEMKLVEDCVKGLIQPYQLAIQIGRSPNAVVKKVNRERKKRNVPI